MKQDELLALLTARIRHDPERGVTSIGFLGKSGWIELGWVSDTVPEEARKYYYDKVWKRFIEKIKKEEIGHANRDTDSPPDAPGVPA